jgi:RimJ/RimL family protein N-acetyltransferase
LSNEDARGTELQALDLRPVAEADCELLWDWANDPVARSASFDSRPIAWREHVEWFRAQQRDTRNRMYVIEESSRPVGIVRFAPSDDRAVVVSVNVAASARGRGIGPRALRQACALVAADVDVSSVVALIKPDNAPSLRAFEQAGFVHSGRAAVRDQEAVVMRWTPGESRAAR